MVPDFKASKNLGCELMQFLDMSWDQIGLPFDIITKEFMKTFNRMLQDLQTQISELIELSDWQQADVWVQK